MSPDECWQMIADFTLAEDWIGVLAAADELPDDTRVAIQWAIGRRWFPVCIREKDRCQFKVYLTEHNLVTKPNRIERDGIRIGWEWVAKVRQKMIDQLE